MLPSEGVNPAGRHSGAGRPAPLSSSCERELAAATRDETRGTRPEGDMMPAASRGLPRAAHPPTQDKAGIPTRHYRMFLLITNHTHTTTCLH